MKFLERTASSRSYPPVALGKSTSLPRRSSCYDCPHPLLSQSPIPQTPGLASSEHIITASYHETLHDKTSPLDESSIPATISPPSGNVNGEGDDAQGSSEVAGETGMRLNPDLKETERITSPFQPEGVECDWQTVFWRLPTSRQSNSHAMPSSAETTAPCQTSAVRAQSSVSGLESHLAEEPAATLGERLAGEMIWGKDEDLKYPYLHLVSPLMYI
jgi:hypothetical protein